MGKQRTAKMRMKTCAYNKRKINPRNMHVTNNNQIVDRLRLCDTYTHTYTIHSIYTNRQRHSSKYFLFTIITLRALANVHSRILYFSALLKMKNTRNKNKKKLQRNNREKSHRLHILDGMNFNARSKLWKI